VAAATDNKPAEAPKQLDNVKTRADVAQEGAKAALGTEASKELAKPGSVAGDHGIKPNPVSGVDGSIHTGPLDKTVGKYMASAPEQGLARSADPKGDPASDATRIKDGTDKATPTGDRPVVKDYSETLQQSGMSKVEADRMAASTYDRFAKLNDGQHLVPGSSPEDQMARINKASKDILAGPPEGRLANGQQDHLTAADRQNMVKDLAARESDPDKYCKQGNHMTCALESMQKQSLEGQDPAKVAEQIASVSNKGYADVTQKDGTTRRVNVDSRSIAPDAESSHNFDPAYHGDQGKRGMAGQVMDALSGQLGADLQAERLGKPTSAQGIDKAAYTYMAAHSDELGGRPGQTKTGEGLFERQKDGSQKLVADNPNMQLWDVAHLNKAMGGQDGAVFAAAGLMTSEKPPQGYPQDLRINTFHNTDELRQKLTEFQNRTGQSGQIGVNAPFLPGGGEDGHGMHAMNIGVNPDGSFRLNNNWSKQYDLAKVSDDIVDKATNPDRWHPKQSVPSDGSTPTPRTEPVPNDHTIFRPGSGTNPNETPADANLRKQDDIWQKQLEENRKKEDQARLDAQKKREEEERKQQEELDKQRLNGLNFYPE
jgi:hypothetical protein